jgi:hypothetical protein
MILHWTTPMGGQADDTYIVKLIGDSNSELFSNYVDVLLTRLLNASVH